LVWMAFLPRPWKTVCFFVVTAWQGGVLTRLNYAFLNPLGLVLAVLLLDDAFLQRFIPILWQKKLAGNALDGKRETIIPARAAMASSLRGGIFAALLVWIFYATCLPLVEMF